MVLMNCLKRTFIIILFLLIISSAVTVHSASLLSIHFIDIGDGDSTLISLPSGENILIDVGSPSSGIEVIHYLKSIGVKRINHLILTHAHDDHIGGIFGLVSEFEVLNFYDNGFSNFESNIYRDYIRVVRQDLSKYRILQADESLHFGDLRVEVINPLLPPTGDPNSDSIVIKVVYGDIKVLLAGDLNRLGERRLLNLGIDLTSQILKVAHHGENDSTSEDFLRSVKPEETIVSISKVDRYARPHPALLERLTKAGVKIHQTNNKGTIILETDGKSYSIFYRRIKRQR